MAQQRKALSAKLDSLSLGGTHRVKGENGHLEVVL